MKDGEAAAAIEGQHKENPGPAAVKQLEFGRHSVFSSSHKHLLTYFYNCLAEN